MSQIAYCVVERVMEWTSQLYDVNKTDYKKHSLNNSVHTLVIMTTVLSH